MLLFYIMLFKLSFSFLWFSLRVNDSQSRFPQTMHRTFENGFHILTTLQFYLNKFFSPNSLQRSYCILLLIVVDILQISNYLPKDHPPQEGFVLPAWQHCQPLASQRLERDLVSAPDSTGPTSVLFLTQNNLINYCKLLRSKYLV